MDQATFKPTASDYISPYLSRPIRDLDDLGADQTGQVRHQWRVILMLGFTRTNVRIGLLVVALVAVLTFLGSKVASADEIDHTWREAVECGTYTGGAISGTGYAAAAGNYAAARS